MSETLIPLDKLDASPDQNRTVFDADYLAGLADSIRAHGVLTPVVVRQSGDRFTLVAGECRTRAARMAGLSEIPARVIDVSDASALLGTLIENVARRDPDPIDEAHGYARALEAGAAASPEELAKSVGVRPARVIGRLSLLSLGDVALERVRVGDLKLTYASAMVGLDPNRQLLALHAYNRVPTPPIDNFRDFCEGLRDAQASEGMSLLDPDAFLQVDSWAADVQARAESPDAPIGVREIAQLLDEVAQSTVHKWAARGIFPPRAGEVSGTPYWRRGVVVDWAVETGRLPAPMLPIG